MFGLGGKLFGINAHVGIGERLARGCAWAYPVFPSGVMLEIFPGLGKGHACRGGSNPGYRNWSSMLSASCL